MPEREYSAGSQYRYGYQGSEKDNEATGLNQAHFTTYFREGDTRLARWWSLDPVSYETPWESPYVLMGNNPILYNDVLGDKIRIKNIPRATKHDEKPASIGRFVRAINRHSSVKVKYNKEDGLLSLKNPNAVGKNEFEMQLISAITSQEQTITLELDPKIKMVPYDAFAYLTVDVGDFYKSSSKAFKLNLLHIIVERMAIKDYDANARRVGENPDQTEFNQAHTKALEAEAKLLSQFYPNNNTTYSGSLEKNEYENVKKKSQDIVIRFTDVQQNIKVKVDRYQGNVIRAKVKKSDR